MAELERTRKRGYALTEAELEPGLGSVAAPVLGPDGTVLGAMNISVPLARVSVAELKRRMAPALVDTVREMSRGLGGEPG